MRRLLATGLVLALALVGVLAWVAARASAAHAESQRRIVHTLETLTSIEKLLSLSEDLLLCVRGYVIAGDEAFLERTPAGREELFLTLARIRTLTADKPHQQANLPPVEALCRRLLDHAATLEELRRNSGYEPAQRLVATRRGKRVMEEIRGAIRTMEEVERDLLRKRQQESEIAGRRTTVAYGALGGAVLAVLAALYLLLARQIAARERADAERDRVFENSLDLLCVSGFDGRFQRVNAAWERILGWPRPELLSRPWSDFVHPEDLERTLAEARKIYAGGSTIHFENRYRCKDGSWRWLSWSVPPPDPGSRVVHAVARDFTDRKRSEILIQELNRDLEARVREVSAANAELEAFSYSVSHDLRAPLRHVDGFVQLLSRHMDGKLDEKAAHYLRTISESAGRMGELIDHLLAFSRLGRTEMRTGPVKLRDLFDEAAADLRREHAARRIEWSIGDLPEVHGDAALLRQVAVNLLSNAVKYSRHRDPARIEVGQAASSNGAAVVYVRDNGAGFDMKYAGKLFGVFQRLHRAEEFEGTGIGLALVQRIVQRHGGRVWAEGEVGRGATFYVEFPGRT